MTSLEYYPVYFEYYFLYRSIQRSSGSLVDEGICRTLDHGTCAQGFVRSGLFRENNGLQAVEKAGKALFPMTP